MPHATPRRHATRAGLAALARIGLGSAVLLLAAACTSPHADRPASAARDSAVVVPPGWPVRVLDAGSHHLGDDVTPEWPEAGQQPEGTRLDIDFEGRANPTEWLLAVHQRHVSNAWTLEVNGREIAELERHEDRRVAHYRLPPGTLVDGPNRLAFVPSQPADDVTLGDVRLIEASLREVFDLRPVQVEVVDADGGRALPARVTVIHADGEPARPYFAEDLLTAVRPGVVYTADGRAGFELPRGRYRIGATHGPEWSLDVAELHVHDGPNPVRLELRHEVDTPGFVAADTHVHTLTFSGHGDASVAERMVTLAAEGVELAVATDHNHNTDYRPWQADAGLDHHFTAVTGNEVTTPVGHMNAFPLDPDDAVPAHDLHDWAPMVADARAKGARAVVLNHPRWPDHERGPFGVLDLDWDTGAFRGGADGALVHPESGAPLGTPGPFAPLPFDAMEVINATCEQADPSVLFRDWFALLNRGERIVGVGTSDSHSVDDPVGQGRTYVAADDRDPGAIDVEAAADALAAGRSSFGMGIFADFTVGDGFGPGDVVPHAGGRELGLQVRVAAPSWVTPRELTLYANGIAAASFPLESAAGRPTDTRLQIEMRLPSAHDAWLVCVVTGDGVDGPWWPSLNDYTLAATNPVWLDADGDGAYTSPRDTARAWLAAPPTEWSDVDDSVVIQHLDLLRRERPADFGPAAAARAAERDRVATWLAALTSPASGPSRR